MANLLTMQPPQEIDARTWKLTWSTDQEDETFYVYRNGKLFNTTRATELLVQAGPGDSPVFEVLTDPDAVPLAAFPSRLLLSWQAVSGARHYRVEEHVGSSWTLRSTRRDDGQGYFTWRTRSLEDGQVHQFRIVAVDDKGNQGTARTFECLMVRHPDVPDVTYAYDAGAVTIAAN